MTARVTGTPNHASASARSSVSTCAEISATETGRPPSTTRTSLPSGPATSS